MSLYAVFADHHPAIEVAGNRVGLYRLAAVLADGQPATLPLDEPPAAWLEEGRLVRADDSPGGRRARSTDPCRGG